MLSVNYHHIWIPAALSRHAPQAQQILPFHSLRVYAMAFNNNDNDGGEAVDNVNTRRRLEVAIKTLKGSQGNMLQTVRIVRCGGPRFLPAHRSARVVCVHQIISFGAAVALCVTGVLHSQLSLRERAFFGLAAASCTSQAFTLSKTVRDWHISSLPGFENTKLMRGSHLWYLQVWASFIISLVLSFYALSSSSSHPEWAGTDGAFLVVTTFTLSATLALAKSVRDRTDAAAFAALDKRMPAQADRSELLASVLVTCQGTAGNTVATVVSLVLSVVITLYGASSMPELTFERVYMTLVR